MTYHFAILPGSDKVEGVAELVNAKPIGLFLAVIVIGPTLLRCKIILWKNHLRLKFRRPERNKRDHYLLLTQKGLYRILKMKVSRSFY